MIQAIPPTETMTSLPNQMRLENSTKPVNHKQYFLGRRQNAQSGPAENNCENRYEVSAARMPDLSPEIVKLYHLKI